MIAEILATGDEIRSGTLVDSNSAFIAERLERLGVSVRRHHCVGDDLQTLTDVLMEIGQRCDVAVVTGGLGPTVDDRSTEAAARAAGAELVLDRRALADIEQFFKERRRLFSDTNKKQALIPHGARTLYNPVGTAPGFCLRIEKCRFFFVPGVPYEMKRMVKDQVLPLIEQMLGAQRQYSLVRTLSTFGLPESVVGEKIDGIADAFPQINPGLRAKFPEIQVKLYLRTDDEQRGQEMLEDAGQWVANRLGIHLFSHEGLTLAETVGRMLLERRATLAVAESCTGGLIGNWLTNTAGSSDYFRMSAVTYHNQAKIDVLGVRPETLANRGAVHETTAGEMAQGVRRVGESTFGLATTGIAGPGGGSEEKPVGTVCIGVATADETLSRRFHFSFGRRLMNKRIFAMAALDMLRRFMIKAFPQE